MEATQSEIVNYWELPYQGQMKIRKNTRTMIQGSGKSLFRISGVMQREDTEECDCEWCQGHTVKTDFTIDDLVVADTAKQAQQIAVERVAMLSDFTWLDPPVVETLFNGSNNDEQLNCAAT